MIENIIYFIMGVAYIILGYQVTSKFRSGNKQIYGIVLLILGALLILFSMGVIKLP